MAASTARRQTIAAVVAPPGSFTVEPASTIRAPKPTAGYATTPTASERAQMARPRANEARMRRIAAVTIVCVR